MVEHHFRSIKEMYNSFYKYLFAQHGMFPVRETEKGYWGVSVADELFDVFNRIGLHNHDHFLDLGSGDGKAVMIASLFTKATGVEHDDWLINVSEDIKDKLYHIPHTNNVSFVNKDFMDHDLSAHDVIFINPDKKDDRIQKKIKDEFSGRLIVYGPMNSFDMLKKPSQEINFEGTPVKIYDI
ncbi:MAG: hypothetical protein ACQEP1_04620 [Nanobdellota archaeon]